VNLDVKEPLSIPPQIA